MCYVTKGEGLKLCDSLRYVISERPLVYCTIFRYAKRKHETKFRNTIQLEISDYESQSAYKRVCKFLKK